MFGKVFGMWKATVPVASRKESCLSDSMKTCCCSLLSVLEAPQAQTLNLHAQPRHHPKTIQQTQARETTSHIKVCTTRRTTLTCQQRGLFQWRSGVCAANDGGVRSLVLGRRAYLVGLWRPLKSSRIGGYHQTNKGKFAYPKGQRGVFRLW